MSPEVLAPLIVLGGVVFAYLVVWVIWRVAFRDLYPNCTCHVCGRRRR